VSKLLVGVVAEESIGPAQRLSVDATTTITYVQTRVTPPGTLRCLGNLAATTAAAIAPAAIRKTWGMAVNLLVEWKLAVAPNNRKCGAYVVQPQICDAKQPLSCTNCGARYGD
jgi:hypothetical protein